MSIDYARAKREMPALKAKLTRAKNSQDPQKIADVVEEAYAAFDRWGAYPDNWHLWQAALREAVSLHRSTGRSLDLSAFTTDLDALMPATWKPVGEAQEERPPLPKPVLKAIRQFRELNANDSSEDEAINSLTLEQTLYAYLEWEGIRGYADTVAAIARRFGAK